MPSLTWQRRRGYSTAPWCGLGDKLVVLVVIIPPLCWAAWRPSLKRQCVAIVMRETWCARRISVCLCYLMKSGSVFASCTLEMAEARYGWALEAAVLLLAVSSAGLGSAHDPDHLVRRLPGQPAVAFRQYAGFVRVGAAGSGKNIFYWLVEAQKGNSSMQPLAFWFNGGPGCSSLGNGGLSELGPFYVDATGKALFLNHFSWNQAANIVFVESPVGVGYSYSDNSSDYDSFTDEQTAQDAYAFLLAWFAKFQEYRGNDMYLIGESYAGHYVPQLAQKIVQHNEEGGFSINLKGFMVGNAWTDPYSDNKGATQFYYTHSLISEGTYLKLIQNCDFAHDLPVDYSLTNETCQAAAEQAFSVEMAEIDIYNVYGPFCNGQSSERGGGSSFFRKNLFLQDPYPDPCNDPITPYLNLPDVVSAFHANDSRNLPWSGCSSTVHQHYSNDDIASSVLPVYRQLLRKGLRIWVFSGDVDGIVPTLSTRYWLRALRLPIETPWYAWNQAAQVGGWTEKYRGITFVTVRGAGHMVPLNQPEKALNLFQHFLKDELLPPFP